jgi:hypothetical protein
MIVVPGKIQSLIMVSRVSAVLKTNIYAKMADNKCENCCMLPIIHCYQEYIASMSFKASKDPLALNSMPSVILSATIFTLVDFNNVPNTTERLLLADHGIEHDLISSNTREIRIH